MGTDIVTELRSLEKEAQEDGEDRYAAWFRYAWKEIKHQRERVEEVAAAYAETEACNSLYEDYLEEDEDD